MSQKLLFLVYIEHGGFGADVAAPIAGLIMEKYLKGKTESEVTSYGKAHLNVLTQLLNKPWFVIKIME